MALAGAYRERIVAALPPGAAFQPLMTLYLTDNTRPDEIARAQDSGFVHAVKYYPAGATTNSDSGVTDLARCAAVLEKMQDAGMPLLLHGEVTDTEVDIFDREVVFIERVLTPLLRKFPGLRAVLEHITTRDAAEYVASASANVAATITAHHLLLNRNALFAGGIRPHAYCLPVLKREDASPGAVAGRDFRQPEIFPRHRQRAARQARQGKRLRPRRYLHRARSDRTLRRGVRSRGRAAEAGRLREFFRRRFLPPAAQPGTYRAQARKLERAARLQAGRRHPGAIAGGRRYRVEARSGMKAAR
ncbi:MAG: hypothetical protein WDN04_10875 [Rhodospirillales bacterium]